MGAVLHSGAGPRQLAALRIAVFGVWFVLLARLPLQNLSLLGSESIESRGLMKLVPVEDLTTSPTALLTIQGLAMVGCVACVLGIRPWVPIALTTSLGILLIDGLVKSSAGYANHAQTAVLYAAFVVALFPAADGWSIMDRFKRPNAPSASGERRWQYVVPLQFCALVLSVAYCFIGLRRLVWGGPDILAGDTTTNWMVTRSLEYSAYPFDWGLYLLEWSWLPGVATAAMLITTIFEVLSPLALLSRRFRLVWLAVIVPFHLGTMFMMRILFWENLVLIAVLFTGLAYRLAREKTGTPSPVPG